MSEVSKPSSEPFAHRHDEPVFRESLKVLGFGLYDLLSTLPLCRVGVHRYCSCCSPMFCVRCGRRDPWS